MAARVQAKKPAPQKEEQVEQIEPASADTEILDLTDELLDEIDGLLEVNAEEFVKSYVQKGGE